MPSQPREMQLSVPNPCLELVISTQSLEQKAGRRRYDIQKNTESSRMYPNFTTRFPEPESRSSLFSQSHKHNTLHGPISTLLSQSTLPIKPYIPDLDPPSKSPNQRYTNDQTGYSTKLESYRELKNNSTVLERHSSMLNTDEEIERLKAELWEKEEEVKKFQNLIQTGSDIMNKITKLEFDKKQFLEKRKQQSMSLDFQIYEKDEVRRKEKQDKEKELVSRLELLRAMKEQESRERLDRAIRAKQYKDQLDVQKYVKDSIKVYSGKVIQKTNPELAAKMLEYKSQGPFKSTSSSANLSPLAPKYTKKAQRTVSYDPITGQVQDTAPYVFGAHPLITKRPQNSEAYSKKTDSHIAEYGTMILNNKNP